MRCARDTGVHVCCGLLVGYEGRELVAMCGVESGEGRGEWNVVKSHVFSAYKGRAYGSSASEGESERSRHVDRRRPMALSDPVR